MGTPACAHGSLPAKSRLSWHLDGQQVVLGLPRPIEAAVQAYLVNLAGVHTKAATASFTTAASSIAIASSAVIASSVAVASATASWGPSWAEPSQAKHEP